MRYPASEKAEIIRLVEQSHLPVRRTLEMLGIPRSPSTSMDGSPVARRFRTDPLGSVANIYPASPTDGAPKWQIRSRTPLQLGGL